MLQFSHRWLVVLALLAISSCARVNNSKHVCTPGKIDNCLCDNGLNGIQICDDKGAAWSACQKCGQIVADGGLADAVGGSDLAAKTDVAAQADLAAKADIAAKTDITAKADIAVKTDIAGKTDLTTKTDFGKKCSLNNECDDQLACTVDTCLNNVCQNNIAVNYCVIAGACVFAATEKPSAPCFICDPSKSTTSYSHLPCVSTFFENLFLSTVQDLAFDSAGNLFVSDSGNLRIHKIASNWLTTVAGSVAGFLDGAALTAQFGYVAGIAIDGTNNIFIADRDNDIIRMLANGQVTTIAGTKPVSGSPVYGYVDGPALSAKFQFPTDVAFDNLGNLLVVDWGNHCIRKIANSAVSTFAGQCKARGFSDGSAALALFNEPIGIAVAANGDVFVADSNNDLIRKISNGVVSTVAGSLGYGFVDGPVASAKFRYPTGLAIDQTGNIYVADRDNHRIRKIAGGQVTTIAGTGTSGFADGPGDKALFNFPSSLVLDNQGNIYVADSSNHRIRKITF